MMKVQDVLLKAMEKKITWCAAAEDAVKLNPQHGAVKMVTRMDALFLVDRHAGQQQMSEEAGLELRRQHTESWAEEIRSECQALSRVVLPRARWARRCIP